MLDWGGKPPQFCAILCVYKGDVMSNNIRKGTTVTLPEPYGEVEIFPASLRQLRKLRDALKDINIDENDPMPDDETIDAMVNAAAVILDKVNKDLAEDKEALEDVVDIVTFNQMVGAAMGADPNE
jgi:hypothetical protein